MCRDDENAGLWETGTVTCHAAAAVEERRQDKTYKPEPGERLYPEVIEPALLHGSGLGVFVPD